MSVAPHFDHRPYLVRPGHKGSSERLPDKSRPEFKNKSAARTALRENIADLTESQRILWASAEYAFLIILQGPDASGKDGLVRHVFSGVNPQGCVVHSFAAPTKRRCGTISCGGRAATCRPRARIKRVQPLVLRRSLDRAGAPKVSRCPALPARSARRRHLAAAL